jgi:hypothetical protein
MILFLGDSFTWGQGLYYSRWLEKGMSFDDINKKLPPFTFHENIISYNDDVHRRKHHFPAIISKHFKKPYCIRYGNGGSNRNIINILENINHQMLFESIELVVVQFTYWSRDIDNPSLVKYYQNKYNVDELGAMFMIREFQIEKIIDLCMRPKGYNKYDSTENEMSIPSSSYNKQIPVRFLCEEPEYASYIEQKYPEKLLTIDFDSKTFKSLSDFKTYNNELPISSDPYKMPGKQNILISNQWPEIKDDHYSEHGNQIIADSLKYHLSPILQ